MSVARWVASRKQRGGRTVEVGGDAGQEAAHRGDGEGAAEVDHARYRAAMECAEAVLSWIRAD